LLENSHKKDHCRIAAYECQLLKEEVTMKMFLISSAVAIVIAVASFYLLQSTGMDTASVMSGQDVRL
ncbi:MAG: hypothetical protein VX073_02565, partial [Pseudomonadota bacterium]|nr:hypothetical protein [Pseudomonadota bacterium]